MEDVLQQLGIAARNSGASTGSEWAEGNGKIITSFSPVDGKKIAEVSSCTDEAYEQIIRTAEKAFVEWRMWPSPKRGDIVRRMGDE
jgi:aldehyde dehydrogenase (NAD+)